MLILDLFALFALAAILAPNLREMHHYRRHS
jgi:hypothetical protein